MHRNLCNVKKLGTTVSGEENTTDPRNAFTFYDGVDDDHVLLKSKRNKINVLESDSEVDDPEVKT